MTRRPDALVSPNGHPGPERRDLIGACTGDVTRHSTFVRSLLLVGWKVNATAKGARGRDDDRRRKAGHRGAVILGVDTHLDFHVAVALDHLGRRLGESSVPTTAKGYERLLRWAEDFGPLRCAGVEGTSSYGAGLARHLRTTGISVMEVERPSAAPSHAAKQIRPHRRRGAPPGRFWPERRRAAQERRRPRGDDPGLADRPPLRG